MVSFGEKAKLKREEIWIRVVVMLLQLYLLLGGVWIVASAWISFGFPICGDKGEMGAFCFLLFLSLLYLPFLFPFLLLEGATVVVATAAEELGLVLEVTPT